MSSFNVRNETPIGVIDQKKRLALARSRIPQFTPAQIQEQVRAGNRRFNPIASNIGRRNLEELFRLGDVSKGIQQAVKQREMAIKIQAFIRGENAREKITRGGRWSLPDLLDTGETAPSWRYEGYEEDTNRDLVAWGPQDSALQPYEADPEGWQFRKNIVDDELEGDPYGIVIDGGAVGNFRPDNPRAWADRYKGGEGGESFNPKLPTHKRTLRKMLEETRRRVGAPK